LLANVIYKIIYQLFLIVIYSSAPRNIVGRRVWRYQKGVTRIRISKKNRNPLLPESAGTQSKLFT